MSEFNPHDLEPFWESWYIDKELGEGSFGYVYKIYKEEYGTKYYSALKIIPVPRTELEVKELQYEGLDQNTSSEYFKDIVEVIYREIQIMAELKGRTNIVSFEDHKIIPKKNEIGYYLLIRMELLENISDYQLKNPLTISQIVNMGRDLCQALILCNKKNIIHRDIKPGNIFVTLDGDFKLGDFGIAKQLDCANEGMSIKGTYGYMAPEVYFGKVYDARVDIYSLGMVLYYYLNNKKGPFISSSTTIQKFSERQNAINRRFQGEKIPNPVLATENLSKIILKAIEYDPNDRYTSAEEFLDALINILPDDLMAIDLATIEAETETNINDENSDGGTIWLDGIGGKNQEIQKELSKIEEKEIDNETKTNDSIELLTPEAKRKYSKFKYIIAISVAVALCFGIFIFISNMVASNNSKGIEISNKLPTDIPTYVPTKVPTKTPTPIPTATPTPVIPEYEMNLDEIGISDFSIIDNCEALTSLSVAFNDLSSLDPLRDSINLTYLNVQKNIIENLDGIEKLSNLVCFNASDNLIHDITVLKELINLNILHLSNNQIENITPLKDLLGLTELYMDGNRDLIDIAVLKNLEQLQILILSNTGILDITSLFGLENLILLDLSNTNVSIEDVEKIKEKLPTCQIVY
ncbi:protein kinase domain-containing protein [Lachnoclostridium sp.]|uniref:protein kinase domain-containing protein n=1 Tax=Lachnoclostridium sp. TaxID=2028282 RepID=UPI0028982BBB|nr:protein kinase [Lachnoclostridium sp.]